MEKIENYFDKNCKITDKDGKIYEGIIAGREYNIETNETLGLIIQINNNQEYITIESIKDIELI